MPKPSNAAFRRGALSAAAALAGRARRAAKARRRQCRAYGMAAALALGLDGTGTALAAARVQHLHCTNPNSGASWTLFVDFDHGLVDSLPATITDQWISWHDPKQGFFDLERRTGKLQLRNASSTGGYFLYYTCQPD
jgi:hypothetical protein